MTKTKQSIFRDSEGKLIQTLPDRIQHKDLEYLEIVGNPDIVEAVIFYLMEVLPVLSVSFHEFIDLIGLKASKYSEDDLMLSGVWGKASEAQKKVYQDNPDNGLTPEKIELLNEIIASEAEKSNKLFNLALQMALFWGGKENKAKKEQAFKLIQQASGLAIELIKQSDYTILAEMFFMILFKPATAWNQCFFLRKVTKTLVSNLSL